MASDLNTSNTKPTPATAPRDQDTAGSQRKAASDTATPDTYRFRDFASI